MGHDYSVDLGGTTRILRYTMAERKELETRFRKGLHALLFEDVMPLNKKGVPTGGGLWEVQVALVHSGIKWAPGKKITEAHVGTWMETWIQNHPDSHIVQILAEVVKAVCESGVLGKAIAIESSEETEPGKENSEG